MDWDFRDPRDMDDLRRELMACPPGLRGDVLAGYVGDPLVGTGFRINEALASSFLGRIAGVASLADQWRGVIDNLIPRDGRCPDGRALERFMEAAVAAGWTDPRARPGLAFG